MSNAAHPLRNARRRFVADYDAFWQEQQGWTSGGGWYELPLQPERRSEAEVPSQHRSAFRRREALRAEAQRLLAEALGAAQEPSRPQAPRSGAGGPRYPYRGVRAEAS